jgi:excisionase family DNA binding protein
MLLLFGQILTQAAMERNQPTHKPTPGIELLTIGETAEALRLSVRSVFRLLRTGELHRIRLGGRTFITADEVRWLVTRSLQQATRQ